jgi:acetoacetate decarboxylase
LRNALIGSRRYEPVRVANGVRGYNRESLDDDEILKAMTTPS